MAIFGIVLSDANTGYDYSKSSKNNINGIHNIEEFVKKPDLKTVKFYLEQSNYLWNSGMFMFQALIFIEELTRPLPNITTSVNKAVSNLLQDLDFIRLEKQAYESLPSDSIDYTLMEKSSKWHLSRLRLFH